MMRKRIHIAETNLTDEKVTTVCLYEPWEPYEHQTLPEWFMLRIRDIVEDSAFLDMKIQLNHDQGGIREIHIRALSA